MCRSLNAKVELRATQIKREKRALRSIESDTKSSSSASSSGEDTSLYSKEVAHSRYRGDGVIRYAIVPMRCIGRTSDRSVPMCCRSHSSYVHSFFSIQNK